MKVANINDPAAGERLIGLNPEMAPAVAAGWRRRLNFFTGRALSDTALITEQAHHAGHLTTRGQIVTAGAISGLDVGLERLSRPGDELDLFFVRVGAGFGVTHAGEDLILSQEMRLSFPELRVVAPASLLAGQPLEPGDGAPQIRRLDERPLRRLLADGVPLPPAGILLLQPVVVETRAEQDPTDPCDDDETSDAFDNLQRVDGCRLLFYAWPADILPLPPISPRRRNLLAHLIFSAEAALKPDQSPPWTEFGLPLALVGLDEQFRPLFADSHAVRRLGGKARPRSALPPQTGSAQLWQARIEQLAEQTNETIAGGASMSQLAGQFRLLPPVGLLPREALEPRAALNHFFPDWYAIEMLPVPEEQLDLVLHESAALEPFDLSQPDRVRVLVPMPQQLYDPDLLQIMPVDPEFQETIDAFAGRRARWLRRRADVRENLALLVEAVKGERPAFPTPDPDALPDEFDDNGELILADDPIDPDDPQLADPEKSYGIETADDGTVTVTAIAALRDYLRQKTPLKGERAIFIDRLAAAPDLPSALKEKVRYVDLGDRVNAKISFSGKMTDSDRSLLLETFKPAAAAGSIREPIEAQINTLFDRSQQDQLDRLDELGLEQFITYLEGLIHAADDKIDLGFALARTDIYRVRQLMLGTTEASKLATSPTLAAIAQGETATASRKDVADFVEKYRLISGPDGAASPPGTLAAGDLPGGGGAGSLFTSGFSRSITITAAGSELFAAGSKPAQPDFGDLLSGATGKSGGLETFNLSSRLASESLSQAGGELFDRSSTRPEINIDDVLGQVPIVGKAPELRNMTVGERLKSPPAQESKDNSVATMFDTVRGLADAGIHLDDLDIAGTLEFSADDNNGVTGSRRVYSIVDLSINNYNRLLNEPDRNDDEGQLFANTVDVVDRTINVLRRVEGRVQAYRQALEKCRETLQTLQGHTREANSRLTTIAIEVSEARHDVAVARALLSEETARVDGINRRRDEIIATHVTYLAYQRPRLSSLIAGDARFHLPGRTLLPAVTTAAVPACLKAPAAVPDDLQQMVDLWREVPVSWLIYVRPKFRQIDKLELLQNTVLTAVNRIPAPPPRSSAPAAGGLLGGSIGQVLTLRRQAVTLQRQTLTTFNPAALAGQSWQRSLADAEQIVSIADILAAPHGKSRLDRELAQELDDIAHVAGCLYAGFAGVVPAIRLDWAERLSQFDEPINLRSLTALPRWGEIDFLERREMQTLVDWLYGRIDLQQPDAVAMTHDLVRVCILLASHAPVNQILAGQIDEPVVVKPGGSINIAIDPGRVRVGMNVLLFDRQELIGQAVVQNLQANKVAATVVETSRPGFQLQSGARVQLGEMGALSRNGRTQGFWQKP